MGWNEATPGKRLEEEEKMTTRTRGTGSWCWKLAGVVACMLLWGYAGFAAGKPLPDEAQKLLEAGHGTTHAAPAQTSHGPTAKHAKTESRGNGHGGGHKSVTITPEKVVLVPPAKLQKLDHARHREAKEVTANLSVDTSGLGAVGKMLIGLVIVALAGALLLRSGTINRMGLAGKLYCGFGSLVVLALVIGGGGYYFLSIVNAEVHLETQTMELDMMADEIESLQNGFLLIGIEDKARGEEILAEHDRVVAEYEGDFEAISAMHLDEEDKKAVEIMRDGVKKYEVAFEHLAKAYHEVEELKKELAESAEHMDELLTEIIHEHEAELRELEAKAGGDATQIMLQTELVEHLFECEVLALKVAHDQVAFMLDKNISRIPTMEKNLGLLLGTLTAVKGILPQLTTDKEEQAADLNVLDEVSLAVHNYIEKTGTLITDELQIAGDLVDCNDDLQIIKTWSIAMSGKAGKIAEATKEEANTASIGLMIVAFLTGSLLAVLISRAITGPINNVITGMRSGSEQVASASNQVSQSSQLMAEGASEQASSLEEVSSSLEEMASMTRQNADNAEQANRMAVDARSAAGKGVDSMTRMSTAINDIKGSSDETAKIIKTIDENAFQTNHLALNAAVEAARAGDAGKGFAVVAEEVRNLAQRSAEAAKNTASLIEESQKNAENGVAVTSEVGEVLNQISDSVGKVSQLISEVTAASNEQAQGIDQVNTAVAQMDKVTQSNAANAEESASASEEMSGQAQELNAMVDMLVTVVGGMKGSANGNAAHQRVTSHPSAEAPTFTRATPALKNRTHHLLQAGPQATSGSGNGGKNRIAATSGAKVVMPDKVIPLDEDEIKDF